MPGGLTKEQSVLIKNFTNLSEKIEKCKSHIEFLKKCQSERVLPKGLNLIKLTTSKELWDADEKQISGLLFNCSEGILKAHLEIKEKK